MTIPKTCKRLAEVDFPIAVVSKHAVREKAIRHGHPSTLHLRWAWRPLASSRAMLMALLLARPRGPALLGGVPPTARRILTEMTWRPPGWAEQIADDAGLRKGLLQFIGDFADWDKAADAVYLAAACALVKAAHPDETPLVVDPFAGGGSIPLEALRIGCDAFASDLNPVAVLINKVMLEDIPRYGKAKIKVRNAAGVEVEADGLAAALRIAGAAVKAAAEKELAEFYPPDPDGSRPIAYLWARTVRCEAPNCGAEIPLVRSFWLAKTANRKRALRYTVSRKAGRPPNLEFEVFEPKKDNEVPKGTVARARATCPCCGMVLAPERVRAQLADQHGGADSIFDQMGQRIGGASLLAVAKTKSGEQGRQYRPGTSLDYVIAGRAQKGLMNLSQAFRNGLNLVPDEPLPPVSTLGFRVQRYGMVVWGDLFTARQKLALILLANTIADQPDKYSITREFPGLALSRFLDISNALCQWESSKNQIRHLFTRQAIPLLWDSAEADIFGAQAGDFSVTLGTMITVIENIVATKSSGQVQLADACLSPLPDESSGVWFTDPPYYDAVPYADLSDFFYVWLKRSLSYKSLLRDPFDRQNPLTPKTREVVQDEVKLIDGRPKNRVL